MRRRKRGDGRGEGKLEEGKRGKKEKERRGEEEGEKGRRGEEKTIDHIHQSPSLQGIFLCKRKNGFPIILEILS